MCYFAGLGYFSCKSFSGLPQLSRVSSVFWNDSYSCHTRFCNCPSTCWQGRHVLVAEPGLVWVSYGLKVMSSLIIRNVRVRGKRTSVRLEQAMWDALLEISGRENRTIDEICTRVSENRLETGFTASLRVYILNYFRDALRASEKGGRVAARSQA